MDKVTKTDAEWMAALSEQAYKVLRKHGTERPFSHDDFPDAPGTYLCAGCGQPLFDASTKFDAGCGWPSFYAPKAADAVEESVDRSFMMRRTEVHCSKCDGHLGHVFPDGPEPTGLRYCMNGVSLNFVPAKD